MGSGWKEQEDVVDWDNIIKEYNDTHMSESQPPKKNISPIVPPQESIPSSESKSQESIPSSESKSQESIPSSEPKPDTVELSVYKIDPPRYPYKRKNCVLSYKIDWEDVPIESLGNG